MHLIKISNYKSRQSSSSQILLLISTGLQCLILRSVLLPLTRQKLIITLSYFMAVYICQTCYLHVTSEETESSRVACTLNLVVLHVFWLDMDLLDHFTPLSRKLCVDNALATHKYFCCWCQQVRIFLVLHGFSSIFFLSNECLCWLAGRIYVYPEVFWNKGQLLAATLWRDRERGR